MKAGPHNSIADICATLRISNRTLYRYTGEHHAETERREIMSFCPQVPELGFPMGVGSA
jgi:hypothetical protein